jgi:hypothetical protein
MPQEFYILAFVQVHFFPDKNGIMDNDSLVKPMVLKEIVVCQHLTPSWVLGREDPTVDDSVFQVRINKFRVAMIVNDDNGYMRIELADGLVRFVPVGTSFFILDMPCHDESHFGFGIVVNIFRQEPDKTNDEKK